MISQILGIAIIGTYYYNFVSLFNTIEILKVYLKISLFVAVIAYPLFFLGLSFNTQGDHRLCSIFKEPAHYVIVVIPSCYYFLKSKKYIPFLIVFGTLILSNSSLGYVGCGLMFLLPNLNLKRIGYFVAVLPFLFGVFYYVYSEYPFFKLRIDDTYDSLNVINTGKFKEQTNLSSYVMISNMFIAKKNIIDHPLGSGIGSHHYMHTEVYSKQMRPPEYLRKQNKQSDNSFDANSLFTRICSEFGIIGFVFIMFFLYKGAKCFSSKKMYFAQGVFIYFLLKLFRDGVYFPPELFFFIWLFYFSFKEHLVHKEKSNIQLAS